MSQPIQQWSQPPIQPTYAPGYEPGQRTLFAQPHRPPAPSTAQVRLHLKPGFLSGWNTRPIVWIDGIPVAASWGDTNAYPIPPGRHRIEVWTAYLYQYGHAATYVDARPGVAADVFYAAPSSWYFSGSIGYTPQENAGTWMIWLSWGFSLAMILFLFFILFLMVLI